MKQLFNHPQSDRAQTVATIPFNELYKIVRDNLDYFHPDKSDPDAFCQDMCVQIEKKMGIYPNVPNLEVSTAEPVSDLAVRNPSVAEYMNHWEGRALKAEAALAALSHVQAPADVVAGWQRKHPMDEWNWVSVNPEDIEHYKAQGQQIRAVYTRPTPQIDEAMVERACKAMAITIAEQDGVVLADAGYEQGKAARPEEHALMQAYTRAALQAAIGGGKTW